MKVLKFGGSSVGNAENIEKVVEIVKNAIETDSCVVVLSAMQGTTDALIETGKFAESGDENFRAKINEIEAKHFEAMRELAAVEHSQNGVLILSKTASTNSKTFAKAFFCCANLRRERLTGSSVSAKFFQPKSFRQSLIRSDIENVWKDSRELITTDSNFGFARLILQQTNEQIKEYFDKSKSRTEIESLYFAGFYRFGCRRYNDDFRTRRFGLYGRDFGGGTGCGSSGNLDGRVRNDDRRSAHCPQYPTNSAHYISRSDGAFAFRRESNLSADDSAGNGRKNSGLDKKYFCAGRFRNA